MMTNTKTSGTDIVPVTLEQVEEVLLHGGELAVVDSDDVQTDMVAQILAADTIQDAFAEFKSVNAQTLRGVPLSVDGIAWRRSAFDQGPKVWALLKCTLLADAPGAGKQGDEIKVSMGGRTTMASFVWAQRHAAMPVYGSFHMEQSTENPERKFYVFKLDPAKLAA